MILIPVFIAIAVIIYLAKNKIVAALIRLRGKLHVRNLHQAIVDADEDKMKTGRKNMVVFNTVTGSFEPTQKRLLKFLAAKGKNKNNGKKTDGRKKFAKPVKRKLDSSEVKRIEKKSLYVTN
jgi:hypothetical protein